MAADQSLARASCDMPRLRFGRADLYTIHSSSWLAASIAPPFGHHALRSQFGSARLLVMIFKSPRPKKELEQHDMLFGSSLQSPR